MQGTQAVQVAVPSALAQREKYAELFDRSDADVVAGNFY